MPTRNQPKLKMRPFSRQDQAKIHLFLTDRLKIAEYAARRAADMLCLEKNDYTKGNMLYQDNVISAIKWLIHTLPITRRLTPEQIGSLILRTMETGRYNSKRGE